MNVSRVLFVFFLALGCGASSGDAIRLRQVVLYRNGVGYFEHRGAVANGAVSLRLGSHEVDDFLSTVTVVDGAEGSRAPSAIVPRTIDDGESRRISLAISPGERDVLVAYVSPTSVWRASYRLILDEAPARSLLQGWAVVDNTTAEDWNDVELTLATQTPFSFAVDLRTPQTVARPDVTGHLTPPITFGPVVSTAGREAFEVDRDGDAILDMNDRCPDDPETFNGMEEDDGCPDRGAVLIEQTSIRIVEPVYFAANSFALRSESGALLDEVAGTLNAHPELRVLEVGGHASSSERDPWRLSADRAAAVRAELLQRGVTSDRLVVQAYASTRPIAAGADERNQRVSFLILEQDNGAPREAPRGLAIGADAVERTSRSIPAPARSSGGTRYPIARRVTIPADGSAMVSVLSTRLDAGEVLYYQPDTRAPESDLHPFRAARMVNASGVDLVPGPVALFTQGEFVGEGLFDAITPGETAFVPYALDASSHVDKSEVSRSEPSRIVSLARGVLIADRIAIRETTYTLEPGAHLPAQWFVRHLVAPGYEARVTEGMLELGAAVIAPGAVVEGRRTSIAIEERRTDRVEIDLFRQLDVDVRPYLAESSLDATVAAELTRLQADRDRVIELAARVRELHTRLGDASQRAGELRASLAQLEGRSPEIARVRRELATRLTAATSESESASAELAAVRANEEQARARLRNDYRDFAIEGR
jgi:outer membrane protein OmpA-like peptidoglycan-associated protein